jgi:putative methyltransferase (TIGR04325 family)
MFKSYLKLILPSFIIKIIQQFFKRDIKFVGNYKDWSGAVHNSLGYSSKIIFLKSKESFLKVLNGEAKYERDSVLFYSDSINYPLMTILSKIQNKKKSCLNILDFGGSFGSTYFQNKKILNNKKKFQWSIIEQSKIVNFCLKKKLNSNLKFYNSIKDYSRNNVVDLVLVSSVLQYIETPFILLDQLIALKADYLLVLKTPVHQKSDQIKVQRVPDYIYKASYPIRIFNKSRLLNYFKINNYQLIKNNFTNEFIDNISFENFFFMRK